MAGVSRWMRSPVESAAEAAKRKAGTEPGTTGSGSTSLRKGRQFWRSEDLKERPLGKRNEPADPP